MSNRLNIGDKLQLGDSLSAGNYSLTMTLISGQIDVQIKRISIPYPTTLGYGPAGSYLEMRASGSLIMFSKEGDILWTTASDGKGGNYAELTNRGALQIKTKGGLVVWDSNKIASEYQSGYLNADLGTQENPGAAAFFQNRLWYIGNGHNTGVYTLSRSLETINPSNTDTDVETDYWGKTNQSTEDQVGIKGKVKVDTEHQPSLLVVNGYMYLIWIQKNEEDAGDVADGSFPQAKNSVWAVRTASAESLEAMTWSTPVQLKNSKGNNLIIKNSNFAVLNWGDYLVGAYHTDNDTKFIAFDTNNWPLDGTTDLTYWTPAGITSQKFYEGFFERIADGSTNKNDIPTSLPVTQTELGKHISMDWFATDGNTNYFVISFYSDDDNKAYVAILQKIKDISDWVSDQEFFDGWGATEVWDNIKTAVQIKTDPAGRVKAFSSDQDSKITVRILNTNEVNTLVNNGFEGPLEYQFKIEQAPVPCYVWKNNPAITSLDGKVATASEVYEFAIFKKDGINLMITHLGRAVHLADEQSLTLNKNTTQATQEIYPLIGIVDAPIPLPATNIQNRPTEYSSQELGKITYGTSKTETSTHTAQSNWSIGFKTSGGATNGAGPAWDVAISGGQGKIHGNTTTEQAFTEMNAITKVDLVKKVLQTQGTLFTNTVTLHKEAFHFYEYSSLLPVLISNAPQVVKTRVSYEKGSGVYSFTPFSVNTGDLKSYTKEGINQKMKQLFTAYQQNPNQPIKLEYDYVNYFASVIEANAVSFEGNKFLEFSWGTSGTQTQNFKAVKDSFTENTWKFDTSAYVGVSEGIGFSVFGVGEKISSKFLAGGTYSMSHSDKESTGDSWGIKGSFSLNSEDPNGNTPGFINGFTFRLYLLKANQRWTDELIAFGKDMDIDSSQIDTGSQPWRIAFVVTSYNGLDENGKSVSYSMD